METILLLVTASMLVTIAIIMCQPRPAAGCLLTTVAVVITLVIAATLDFVK